MSDIFLQEDITSLFDNRFIVIIGDSIQRAVYKDFVLLLQKNRYLTDSQLRSKGEFTFSGDKLIEGGQYGEMTNGIRYREVRQYQTDFHLVRFYFVTRCYNAYMESILTDLSKDPRPDVILMNSCLWDISRYGPRSVDQYKENLETLFRRFKEVLPESCLVVWNMTLPISKKARGGFLIPQVEYMNSSLRLDILEANFYVHKLALMNGVNTLDLHYYLRHQLQRRAGDGVHWDMTAHRRMTNLILTHIAQAWDVKQPNHAHTVLSLKKPCVDHEQFQQADTNFNFGCGKQVLSNINTIYNQNVHVKSVPVSSQRNINIANNFGNPVSLKVGQQFSTNQKWNENNNQRLSQIPKASLLSQPTANNFKFDRPEVGRNININVDKYGQQMNDDQTANIARYGGPIRNINFQGTSLPSNPYPVSLLDWTPYRNEDFRGQWFDDDGNQMPDRARNQPYGRRVRH
ncbi:PC-esterase domain-containing protein 1A-like isoform X2 [Dreissena polymorpha]|uniref:PC-esterase domain-containing protein 1A-like isoform X2 n=1 Tax=Dreissena polymorpha TaxID=45954 RepID=UPI00226451E8|nr:PC-esterase domain-containing protein 1A-like isoform X2 [Dreissena polymorpha]